MPSHNPLTSTLTTTRSPGWPRARHPIDLPGALPHGVPGQSCTTPAAGLFEGCPDGMPHEPRCGLAEQTRSEPCTHTCHVAVRAEADALVSRYAAARGDIGRTLASAFTPKCSRHRSGTVTRHAL